MADRPQGFLTYQGIPVWRHAVLIQWALQIVSTIMVVTLVLWFFSNVAFAISDRDIPFGWRFFSRDYGTPVPEHALPFNDSDDSYAYALLVAATNTILLAVAGVILAIILGILIGIARISSNWLLSRLALVYVEFFRNVPLLVQLLFIFYFILILPPITETYNLFDTVYLNNAGLAIPQPTLDHGITPGLAWLIAALAGIVIGIAIHRYLVKRETLTGKVSYPVATGFGVAVGVALIAWLVVWMMSGDTPMGWSTPEQDDRFGRLEGGLRVRSGAIVMLIGLVMYTASFIAEIVRAGIQSVSKGQTEAALAVGLTPMGVLRNITFPQALRVIIPPLISQCLNLTKNSSLAPAVGFADLTNVGITMTQTAPAINIFIVIMLAYLAMSLTWSAVGNFYNWRTRIVGA